MRSGTALSHVLLTCSVIAALTAALFDASPASALVTPMPGTVLAHGDNRVFSPHHLRTGQTLICQVGKVRAVGHVPKRGHKTFVSARGLTHGATLTVATRNDLRVVASCR